MIELTDADLVRLAYQERIKSAFVYLATARLSSALVTFRNEVIHARAARDAALVLVEEQK